MKANQLVGKLALRTAPAKVNYRGGIDNSYRNGNGILIVKVTKDHIYYKDGNYCSTLGSEWMDDNWTVYDETAFAIKTNKYRNMKSSRRLTS